MAGLINMPLSQSDLECRRFDEVWTQLDLLSKPQDVFHQSHLQEYLVTYLKLEVPTFLSTLSCMHLDH